MSSLITDPDTLARLVSRAVRDAVAAELPPLVKRATQKEWLTKEELKELTGWSDRTVQHLRDSRQIPFSQHGRKIVYPTEGINDFLRAHRVKSRSEG